MAFGSSVVVLAESGGDVGLWKMVRMAYTCEAIEGGAGWPEESLDSVVATSSDASAIESGEMDGGSVVVVGSGNDSMGSNKLANKQMTANVLHSAEPPVRVVCAIMTDRFK